MCFSVSLLMDTSGSVGIKYVNFLLSGSSPNLHSTLPVTANTTESVHFKFIVHLIFLLPSHFSFIRGKAVRFKREIRMKHHMIMQWRGKRLVLPQYYQCGMF